LVPAGDLYDSVDRSEVAPPTFYALLHLWRAVFGDSEFALRLMSVCAAVPLVGVTAWLSAMLGKRRLAGVFGGLMAALSPLVLEYGTQVRAYIFCMLATTLAVAAATRYLTGGARERKWLVLSGVAAVGALWLHYTAIPVIAALALWLLIDRRVTRRAALGYAATLVVAQLIVTPLMLSQSENAGAKAFGALTWENVVRTFGGPLDGRYRVSVVFAPGVRGCARDRRRLGPSPLDRRAQGGGRDRPRLATRVAGAHLGVGRCPAQPLLGGRGPADRRGDRCGGRTSAHAVASRGRRALHGRRGIDRFAHR
jgi:4-amino-4-deoxy-L-arabinose transferase-like glycosyltransferase